MCPFPPVKMQNKSLMGKLLFVSVKINLSWEITVWQQYYFSQLCFWRKNTILSKCIPEMKRYEKQIALHVSNSNPQMFVLLQIIFRAFIPEEFWSWYVTLLLSWQLPQRLVAWKHTEACTDPFPLWQKGQRCSMLQWQGELYIAPYDGVIPG